MDIIPLKNGQPIEFGKKSTFIFAVDINPHTSVGDRKPTSGSIFINGIEIILTDQDILSPLHIIQKISTTAIPGWEIRKNILSNYVYFESILFENLPEPVLDTGTTKGIDFNSKTYTSGALPPPEPLPIIALFEGRPTYLETLSFGGYCRLFLSQDGINFIEIGYSKRLTIAPPNSYLKVEYNTAEAVKITNKTGPFIPVPRINNVTTAFSDYIINQNDNIIETTTPLISIFLPLAIDHTGQEYTINNNSVGHVYIFPSSSDTISGKTIQILDRDNAMTVYSNGYSWRFK